MNFKRISLALALCGALAACGPRSGVESSVPDSYPALWEVTGEDGSEEGWLFGTIHALPDGTQWRSPEFRDVVARADTLVVEVGNLGDRQRLAEVFQSLAYDRVPTAPLAQRVSPEWRDELAGLLERAGTDGTRLDAMESWAAALTLAQLAQTGRSENGADLSLLGDFEGRSVVELEGAGAQLAIFDTLPEEEQRDLLDAVIEEAAASQGDEERLANAWKKGDLDRLLALTRVGILADPELKEALLDARNRAWAARIERLLASPEKPLVAVGAGHLLGPEGLPALLAARGYMVRRIR